VITQSEDTPATLYGIFEIGDSSKNTVIYFDSFYLGGAPSTVALNSSALYSAVCYRGTYLKKSIGQCPFQ
jgi:hypothetical protein